MTNRRSLFYFILSLTIISCIYISTLPYTVQQGDTGELVINSFFLRLSHPPGYPLFHFLNYLATHLVPFKTLYWKSSIMQCLLSIAMFTVLFLFYKNLNRKSLVPTLLILTLATSNLFWKYSILPDVFSLNNFFIAVICYLYLKSTSSHKLILILVTFSLGLTNHHTMIFLSPLIFHVIWTEGIVGKNYRQLFLGISGGMFIFSVLYLSLFLFDDKALTSWGDLKTLKDLFFHLIRKDYGTFQLTSLKDNSVYLEILNEYFYQLSHDFWSLFIILFILLYLQLRKKFKTKFSHLLVLITFIFYVLFFFSRAQISPEGFKHEVLSRFFILPNLLFFILIFDLEITDQFSKNKSIFISLILFFNISFNLWFNFQQNNLSKNTILEDYFKNMLSMIPNNSILIAQGDISLFNIYYIQHSLNYKSSIQVISPVLLKYPWYQAKVGISSKTFDYLGSDEIIKYLFTNFQKPIFIVPYFYPLFAHSVNRIGVEVKGIVGQLNMSGKLNYNCQPFNEYSLRSIPSKDNPEIYSLHQQFFNNYADCFFNKAHQFAQNGSFKEAYDFSQKAQEITLLHLPSKLLSCEMEKKLNLNFKKCYSEFNNALQKSYDYYNLVPR